MKNQSVLSIIKKSLHILISSGYHSVGIDYFDYGQEQQHYGAADFVAVVVAVEDDFVDEVWLG